jgi:hypothetical protein
MAAVGFSIAMWAFIAMAVLGLVLKVVGPKDAEEGLAAAGITLPPAFSLESASPADTGGAKALPPALEIAPGAILRLDGRPLDAAAGKPPEPAAPGEPGKQPEAPAKPAPAAAPH